MNLQKIQEKKKGISPIIATLLLILIAIAAGVIVYAYVIGFIGNSTSNTGNNTSVLSIDNACVSSGANTACTGSTAFYAVIRNVGTTTLTASSAAAIYFTDITQGSAPTYSGTLSCSTPSNGVAPGGTFTCSSSGGYWSSTVGTGDSVSLKIVFVDGGTATTTVKAIA